MIQDDVVDMLQTLWNTDAVFAVVLLILGGALGGYVHSRGAKRPVKMTEYILTGFAGASVFVGIVASMNGVQLFSMFGSSNVHAIPLEPGVLTILGELSGGSEVSKDYAHKIVSAVIEHNMKPDQINPGSKIQAVLALFSYSVIGGYGGGGILAKTYDRFMADQVAEQNDKIEKIDGTVQESKKKIAEFSVYTSIDKARTLMNQKSYDEVVSICDAAMAELNYPTHMRLNALKAQALRYSGKIGKAIDTLHIGIQDEHNSQQLISLVRFNLALYLIIQADEEGTDLTEERKKEIKHCLHLAMNYGDTLHRFQESFTWTQEKDSEEDSNIEPMAEWLDSDVVNALRKHQWFSDWASQKLKIKADGLAG